MVIKKFFIIAIENFIIPILLFSRGNDQGFGGGNYNQGGGWNQGSQGPWDQNQGGGGGGWGGPNNNQNNGWGSNDFGSNYQQGYTAGPVRGGGGFGGNSRNAPYSGGPQQSYGGGKS